MKSAKRTSHTRLEVADARVAPVEDGSIQVQVTFSFSPWDAVSLAPLLFQSDALQAVEAVIESGFDTLDRQDAIDAGTVVLLENTGTYLRVHDPLLCEGRWCTVHTRSAHGMRGWPQQWRADRGFMERRCVHGVGHPDPDEAHSPNGLPNAGVHGCDGCCGGMYEDLEEVDEPGTSSDYLGEDLL